MSASNAAPWAGGRETARRLSNWLGGVGAELAALAALLLATAAFGRTFSHIELGFSWLHPTEAVLGLVTVVVLVQIGPREAWRRVAATGVLIPLAIFWLFGAIAAVRGLVEWGFSLTLEDIGLVEYSLLIPIVALTVTSREQLLWLTTLIGLSGILAIAVQSVELWTPSAWDLETQLNLIEVATGMYIGVYVVWVLARLASDVPVPRWHQVLMVLGVGLIVVGLSRAAWLAVLAAMALTILLAVRRRRWVAASAAAAAVVLGVAFSIPVENVGERSRGSDGPNVANEIGASFEPDGEGGQNVNARWRLAYWRFTLEESAERPLNGVGFGRPANFIWNGVPYDRRTGDPSDSHDVTPPHNSFMNVLYRMGVLAMLAVAAIVLIAVRRLLPVIRRARGEDRAAAIWLLATLTITTIVASLAVALEGPYMGIFFWTGLGLALLAPHLLHAPEGSSQAPAATARPGVSAANEGQ